MAGKSRHNQDDVIVQAIARGEPQTTAAKLAGCSATTVRRRLDEPEFRSRVEAFRRGMLDQASGRLSDIMSKAVQCLSELLDGSNPPGIRLGSARAVAELLFRSREILSIEERLAELESRMTSPDPRGEL